MKKENWMRNQILFFAAVILLIIFFNIYSQKYTVSLRKNHIIVCGTIMNMLSGKGVNAVYEFYLDGKNFQYNKSTDPVTLDNYKKGIYRVLIAVERNHPDNNKILGESETYQEYDIKPNDTLGIKCK